MTVNASMHPTSDASQAVSTGGVNCTELIVIPTALEDSRCESVKARSFPIGDAHNKSCENSRTCAANYV